ncbi:putative phd-finger domain-containing protein [Golovinomyces cichoracearum]|uniref:Putative phd-finger domain-containing protein n=1 Tax=Golovinomyces cichoracearum TaxID=62708 RepID=A0A420H213_9PEZI|nr:putative phd-finger domain-containing protein [Golovinomyces cichoracearum]
MSCEPQSCSDLSVMHTPKRSVLSSAVSSPNLGTPQSNIERETCTGWTPYFAEEYSVFNSTPGRLINCHTFTPSQVWNTSRENITTEIDPQIEYLDDNDDDGSTSNLKCKELIPSVYDSLTEGFRTYNSGGRSVTPNNLRNKVEELFSGQTATPPASISKKSRKLEHSLSNTAFNKLRLFCTTPTTVRQNTSSSVFADPTLSSHESCFEKEAEIHSTGLGFSENDIFYSLLNKGTDASCNWSMHTGLYHDNTNFLGPSHDTLPHNSDILDFEPFSPEKSDRIDLSHSSVMPFKLSNKKNFNSSLRNLSTTGVNPGLLLSRKSSSSMSSTSKELSSSVAPSSKKFGNLIPYQHQRREYLRSQEKRKFNQSLRDWKKRRVYDSETENSPAESPTRSDHLGGKRQCKGEILYYSKSATKRSLFTTKTCGDSSPESFAKLPPTSTQIQVKLTIDSKGRAQTETFTGTSMKRRKMICPFEIFHDKASLFEDHFSDKESNISPNTYTFMTSTENFASTKMAHPRNMREEDICIVKSRNHECINQKIASEKSNNEFESFFNGKMSGDATLELQRMIAHRKKKGYAIELKRNRSPHGDFQNN